MKHKMSKLLSVLLCCVMLLTLLPVTAAAVDGDALTQSWTVSGSKTATNLDSNFESQVTLSLPSAEEPLVTDVVFVLDKSTSPYLEDKALEMLSGLKTQVESSNAKVKVGVVIFNKVANKVLGLTDLNTGYDAIKAAIQTQFSSGTNTHAGLLAGKEMLEGDTSVDASRKYLIFVSDGITYMYNAEPTVTAWSFNMPNAADDWHGSGSWGVFAGPDNWKSKYHTVDAPKDWGTWMKTIGPMISQQGTTYEYPYGGTVANATPENIDTWDADYAMSIDKALYLTYQVYQKLKDTGYNVYAMAAETDSGDDYPWGPSFMKYLAGVETVSFEAIKNDILYYVGPRSTVTDVMGYVKDDYNFDFVADAAKLTMTVDGVKLTTQKIDENSYGFGESDNQGNYPYVLTYYPANDGTEKFEWTMNVPVTINEPVTLTYSVKLMNPKTAAGTYGQYDRDGSQGYSSGLYTNNSAVLKPVDSEGRTGRDYFFPKPTVSYTVASSRPTTKPSTTKPISSPKTFDAGIALYAGMALLSLTGGAWVVNKKRSGK